MQKTDTRISNKLEVSGQIPAEVGQFKNIFKISSANCQLAIDYNYAKNLMLAPLVERNVNKTHIVAGVVSEGQSGQTENNQCLVHGEWVVSYETCETKRSLYSNYVTENIVIPMLKAFTVVFNTGRVGGVTNQSARGPIHGSEYCDLQWSQLVIHYDCNCTLFGSLTWNY